MKSFLIQAARRGRVLGVVAVLAATTLAAGCGGGSESTAPATTTTRRRRPVPSTKTGLAALPSLDAQRRNRWDRISGPEGSSLRANSSSEAEPASPAGRSGTVGWAGGGCRAGPDRGPGAGRGRPVAACAGCRGGIAGTVM